MVLVLNFSGRSRLALRALSQRPRLFAVAFAIFVASAAWPSFVYADEDGKTSPSKKPASPSARTEVGAKKARVYQQEEVLRGNSRTTRKKPPAFLRRLFVYDLPQGDPKLRRELGLRTAVDTQDYFRMHAERVKKLGLAAFDQHWVEVCDFFGVPLDKNDPKSMSAAYEKLRTVLSIVLDSHDLAKQYEPTGAEKNSFVPVSEGLFRMMGVEIRNLPMGKQRNAALEFMRGFNEMDGAFAIEAMARGMAAVGLEETAALQDFMMFFEKVADNVDRSLYSMSAIELNKENEPFSKYSTEKLDHFKIGAPKDKDGKSRYPEGVYRDLMRKVAKTIERGYMVRVAGMSHLARHRDLYRTWKRAEAFRKAHRTGCYADLLRMFFD